MNSTVSDQLILNQLKEGKSSAFEAVFRQYFKVLVVYAKNYTKDLDAAQDIAQEVFANLYEKRNSLTIHTSLKAFLYASVRNRCLDQLKSHQIQARHKEMIKHTSSEIDDDTELIYKTELQEKIYLAIAKLPEQNQKIFRMSRLDGKSNQEIADELKLSKRTVETHISNALKTIKSLIFIASIVLIIISIKTFFKKF
ncbi:RNA polymerase sigma-70 factor [Aquimarina brevivitae]|uniref:RNA polymerase sigma-70 factor (ECF subfamily) n=1 Tax=Aquimarina brevivitae TaxID=323412 RepID=A0A4Q7P4A0_9FLAO|nr:RNA polymerase sigma-70 factor [Aquimarina brevivitae]RZS93522.1 RNA polymerase sigma-70 factor (ECF subfamily) [Aquimarina brevivitae]